MEKDIFKHQDTQILLAKVQEYYAEETKNKLEKQSVFIISNKEIVKNEYHKKKRDIMS